MRKFLAAAALTGIIAIGAMGQKGLIMSDLNSDRSTPNCTVKVDYGVMIGGFTGVMIGGLVGVMIGGLSGTSGCAETEVKDDSLTGIIFAD